MWFFVVVFYYFLLGFILPKNPSFHLLSFSSAWSTYFRMFYNTDLLLMIMFYFSFISKNVLILLLFLKYILADYKILCWNFYFAMVRILYQYLLISIVSDEKPAVIDIIALQNVMCLGIFPWILLRFLFLIHQFDYGFTSHGLHIYIVVNWTSRICTIVFH